MKALARSPQARYRTALEFAVALEQVIPPMGQRALGEWVAAAAKDELSLRERMRCAVDRSTRVGLSSQYPAPDPTRRFSIPVESGTSLRAVSEVTISTVAVTPRRPRLSQRVAWVTACGAIALFAGGMERAWWSRATALHEERSTPTAVRNLSASNEVGGPPGEPAIAPERGGEAHGAEPAANAWPGVRSAASAGAFATPVAASVEGSMALASSSRDGIHAVAPPRQHSGKSKGALSPSSVMSQSVNQARSGSPDGELGAIGGRE
jgi:hypothetical protein